MPLKTILITGCGNGSYGHYQAKEYLSLGFHVYATSARLSDMTDLTRVSGHTTFLPLDFTDRYSIENTIRAVSLGCGGKLDTTHRNLWKHGHGDQKVPDYNRDTKMFRANVAGTIELNHVFAGMVIAAKGRMQFVGSLSASRPESTHPEYCASKATLGVYVREMKIAMRPLGVHVNMFSPKRPRDKPAKGTAFGTVSRLPITSIGSKNICIDLLLI